MSSSSQSYCGETRRSAPVGTELCCHGSAGTGRRQQHAGCLRVVPLSHLDNKLWSTRYTAPFVTKGCQITCRRGLTFPRRLCGAAGMRRAEQHRAPAIPARLLSDPLGQEGQSLGGNTCASTAIALHRQPAQWAPRPHRHNGSQASAGRGPAPPGPAQPARPGCHVCPPTSPRPAPRWPMRSAARRAAPTGPREERPAGAHALPPPRGPTGKRVFRPPALPPSARGGGRGADSLSRRAPWPPPGHVRAARQDAAPFPGWAPAAILG